MRQVLLAGLDFGSTTSGMLLARAAWRRRAASGRVTLDAPEVVFRSDPVFTPFEEHAPRLDRQRLEALLDEWTEGSGADLRDVFAGGVIITGLAARSENARELARLLGTRFGDMVVATANDPGLESWLAFMGNCARLGRSHPDERMLNLDIGGGTTNSALGIAGNVHEVGCHHIGARHWRFRPGSFELVDLSVIGRQVMDVLDIEADVGVTLDVSAIERVVGYLVTALEALATAQCGLFGTPDFAMLVDRPLETDGDDARERGRTATGGDSPPAITFSGGIGELIYRGSVGVALPERTAFGDLGVELARGILASPVLNRDLERLRPDALGRATVYGLGLHSTELSGATLYLPDPALLPLSDLPIVARVPYDAERATLERALRLAPARSEGTCLQLIGDGSVSPDRERLKAFASTLNESLDAVGFPPERTMVLLTEHNLGKSMGNYLTEWGRRPRRLVVIDEIPDRQAQFVNVGRYRDGAVPVSCYGVG